MFATRRRFAILTATWSIVALCPAQDVAALADAHLTKLLAENKFSGSVLIVRGGKILLSKGYGLADRELNVPNTTRTKFRLGSITKQFTAAAIVQLAQQGKLSLDDPASKYVPESHEGWKKVTIRHLLRHTSGVPSFTSFPEYKTFKHFASTPAELIARFKDKPLEFEPGAEYRYSNSGYYLLGEIVAKASGTTYEGYLQKHIFEPLGMTDSRLDSNADIIPNRAAGYTRDAAKVRNADFIHMSIPGGAGALLSTVEDLYKWDRALYSEKVLPKKALDEMFTPDKDNYGYGWIIRTENNRRSISHGGGIEGFNTLILRYPDDDAVMILLSNINTNPDSLGRELQAILFDGTR